MSRSGIVDSVVSVLRNGFVNLLSKVETMKEWLQHLKVEIMDVMVASANICFALYSLRELHGESKLYSSSFFGSSIFGQTYVVFIFF